MLQLLTILLAIMGLKVDIHAAQTMILRELLFLPSARYSDLQKPTKLTSDHFNFHIARLIDLGLVKKVKRGEYKLTVQGKEYANRIDTDNNTLERQPKSAVIFALERKNGNEIEYLFQQRKKNPYYDFWGFPSGKVRWGENVVETARRESLEETGLDANFEIRSVYHEIVKDAASGKVIEDKIFFIIIGRNVEGALITDFEGGHNEWLTPEQALAKPKKYQTFTYEVNLLNTPHWFNEQTVIYSDQEF